MNRRDYGRAIVRGAPAGNITIMILMSLDSRPMPIHYQQAA